MTVSLQWRVRFVCFAFCTVIGLCCAFPVVATEGTAGEGVGAGDMFYTYTLEEIVLAGLKENSTLRLAELTMSQAAARLKAERGTTELQGFIGPVLASGTLGGLAWPESAIKDSADEDTWKAVAAENGWESGVRVAFTKMVPSGGNFSLDLKWGAVGGLGAEPLGDNIYTAKLSSEMSWTQPLFRDAKLFAPWWDMERADDALKKMKLAKDSTTHNEIIAMTKLFFEVVEAQEKQDTASQALEAIMEQSRTISNKVTMGMSSPLDLKAMDVEVAQAQHAVTQNRRRLDLAKRELSQATGLSIGAMCRLLPPPPITFDTPLDDTIAKVLRDSPEIQVQTIEMDTARQAWKKAQQDAKPKVDLGLSVNDAGAWRIGVDINYYFWDGHTARERSEAAALELQKAVTTLESLTEDIKLSIRREYYEYLDSEEQIKLADLRLAQTEEVLDATRRRYGLRMATELEMMDALNRLREAKAERATAVYHRTVVAIRLLARTDQLIRIFPNIVWKQQGGGLH